MNGNKQRARIVENKKESKNAASKFTSCKLQQSNLQRRRLFNSNNKAFVLSALLNKYLLVYLRAFGCCSHLLGLIVLLFVNVAGEEKQTNKQSKIKKRNKQATEDKCREQKKTRPRQSCFRCWQATSALHARLVRASLKIILRKFQFAFILPDLHFLFCARLEPFSTCFTFRLLVGLCLIALLAGTRSVEQIKLC